jgi:hypothetical protein
LDGGYYLFLIVATLFLRRCIRCCSSLGTPAAPAAAAVVRFGLQGVLGKFQVFHTVGKRSWKVEMAAAGPNHMQAKLVLLGDMGAGKSSLVLRFVKGQFFDYQVFPLSSPPSLHVSPSLLV